MQPYLKLMRSILYADIFGGVLLFFSAALAIYMSNSSYASIYDTLSHLILTLPVPYFTFSKPLLFWLNDGLMALFFLLVGLEIKREMIGGMLRDRSRLVLPLVGAIGGIILPSCIYYFLNSHDPIASQGWAIPAATDIAFSLGILSLLGKRVSTSLKLFLTALAVLDDIGAILIIAIYYTPHLSKIALITSAILLVILFIFNRLQVKRLTPYLVVGFAMWFSLLRSGIHATLAGVLLALFIPHDLDPHTDSPLETLEKRLFSYVTFFILPLFAFFNSGFSLSGLGYGHFVDPVMLGIAAGLFIGKQIGVFSACWMTIKLRFATLPADISWSNLYAVSVLCGVGFTMSLFIGTLAFSDHELEFAGQVRLGICVGSSLAGMIGYTLLRVLKKPEGKTRLN